VISTFAEVADDDALDGLGRAVGVGVVAAGARVERDQTRRQALDRRCAGAALLDQPVEHGTARQPPHAHRVLDGIGRLGVLISERERPVALEDRHDAEIDARREPAVQPYLFAAEVQTPFERRVVEEREADRLLHLVDHVAGEEDPRDVRLLDRHLLRPLRMEPRIAQRRDQAGNVSVVAHRGRKKGGRSARPPS
jgi:hypothetical protein